MDRTNNHSESSLGCQECQNGLQEYLDGTLEKAVSLQFFLHLRECQTCQTEHENLQALFGMLDSLPAHEVPADFDDKILASIPLAGYQAMEPIRRQRVAVYLEEEFLPAIVRAPGVRLAGALVAAAGLVAGQTVNGMDSISAVSLLGLVPELLVRLQGVGRRVAHHLNRSEDVSRSES